MSKKKTNKLSSYNPTFKVGDVVIDTKADLLDFGKRVFTVMNISTRPNEYEEKKNRGRKIYQLQGHKDYEASGVSQLEYCDKVDRDYELFAIDVLDEETFNFLRQYHPSTNGFQRRYAEFSKLSANEQVRQLRIIKKLAEQKKSEGAKLISESQKLDSSYETLWKYFLIQHELKGGNRE